MTAKVCGPLRSGVLVEAGGLQLAEVDLRRQAFLRGFDLEHTFRVVRQTLG
ncbi:hypothetical protein ABZV75_25695 [Streptomyces flaveolus]